MGESLAQLGAVPEAPPSLQGADAELALIQNARPYPGPAFVGPTWIAYAVDRFVRPDRMSVRIWPGVVAQVIDRHQRYVSLYFRNESPPDIQAVLLALAGELRIAFDAGVD